MKYITSILLLIIGLSLNAQHSERFKELVSELKEIETKPDTLYYGNGNIWIVGTAITYEHNSEHYSNLTGKERQYFRNGKISVETELDKFGNILKWTTYDKDGYKIDEYITVSIDTKAKDLTEFLNSDKHFIYIRNEKFYRCSSKLGVMYLHKEGQTVNGKKVGKWKFYDENGELQKVKTY